MPAQSGHLGKSNEELAAGDLVLRLFMQLVVATATHIR
jgi:hypothetical protein